MSRHLGGCHCGAVRFAIDVDIERLLECNCSLCTRKGILHVPVTDDRFELLTGEDALTLYRFGSGVASHWFCRHCGIHAFGRPRCIRLLALVDRGGRELPIAADFIGLRYLADADQRVEVQLEPTDDEDRIVLLPESRRPAESE